MRISGRPGFSSGNDATGIAGLAELCRSHGVDLVAMEASGPRRLELHHQPNQAAIDAIIY